MKTLILIIIAIALIALIFIGHHVTPPPVDTGIHVGDIIPISWIPTDINADHVQIMVLRQTNTNPYTYENVRLIENLPNNGSYALVASTSDVGGIYAQVGCPHDITVECRASGLIGPYVIK